MYDHFDQSMKNHLLEVIEQHVLLECKLVRIIEDLHDMLSVCDAEFPGSGKSFALQEVIKKLKTMGLEGVDYE